MPDLSVYNNIDGIFTAATSFGTEDFPAVRNITAATQAPSTSASSTAQGAGVVQFAGSISILYRTFFVFNTSGITVAPSSATFSVFTKTNHDSPCRIIKYGGTVMLLLQQEILMIYLVFRLIILCQVM